ncbi:hypothetical protein MC885_012694 [Smutsia gigantea]|nr:hypothetical protein MC885_012694 [Smutsia gigantea]
MLIVELLCFPPSSGMVSFPVSCTELQCAAWHPPQHRRWRCRAQCCPLQSRAGSRESTAPLCRGAVRSVPTDFAGLWVLAVEEHTVASSHGAPVDLRGLGRKGRSTCFQHCPLAPI